MRSDTIAALIRRAPAEEIAETLVTERQIREFWPVCSMTVYRAVRQEIDPFPRPQRIRGRNYWRLGEVRAWLNRQGGDDVGQEAPEAAARAAG